MTKGLIIISLYILSIFVYGIWKVGDPKNSEEFYGQLKGAMSELTVAFPVWLVWLFVVFVGFIVYSVWPIWMFEGIIKKITNKGETND